MWNESQFANTDPISTAKQTPMTARHYAETLVSKDGGKEEHRERIEYLFHADTAYLIAHGFTNRPTHHWRRYWNHATRHMTMHLNNGKSRKIIAYF